MKVIISGALGRMGKELVALAKNGYRQAEIVALVDCFSKQEGVLQHISEYKGDADVIVDFSHHSATLEICSYAAEKKLPVVIATTGQTDSENEIIADTAKKTAVFRSGNMSLGIALLADLVKKAVQAFPDADVEIVEAHHNRKLDAPSGTALMLANAAKAVRKDATLVCGRSGNRKREKQEIGIHSLRLGNVVGIHEVIISTDNQSITLKHEASNRALFAEGGLDAAAFMVGKSVGLYDMYDILGG